MESLDAKTHALLQIVVRDRFVEKAWLKAFTEEGERCFERLRDPLARRMFEEFAASAFSTENPYPPYPTDRYQDLENRFRNLFRSFADLYRERHSPASFQKLEAEICDRMMDRMIGVLEELYQIPEGADSVVQTSVAKITSDSRVLVAWVNALGYGEKEAAHRMLSSFGRAQVKPPKGFRDHVNSELRHCRRLQCAVFSERRRCLADPDYEILEGQMKRAVEGYLLTLFGYVERQTDCVRLQYRVAAWTLLSRIFGHFSELSQQTDHLLAAQALSVILEEETSHSRRIQRAIRALSDQDRQVAESVRTFEQQLFERMTRKVEGLMLEYQDPLSTCGESGRLRQGSRVLSA